MRDVPRGHDVVAVADLGDRLGLGTARDRVMLPDHITVADPQITAMACEVFVERIGTQHGPRGDRVALAERSPALHVDIRFKNAIAADRHIRFDDAIVTHAHTGADLSGALDFRSPRDSSRRVDCHDLYDTSRARLPRSQCFFAISFLTSSIVKIGSAPQPSAPHDHPKGRRNGWAFCNDTPPKKVTASD